MLFIVQEIDYYHMTWINIKWLLVEGTKFICEQKELTQVIIEVKNTNNIIKFMDSCADLNLLLYYVLSISLHEIIINNLFLITCKYNFVQWYYDNNAK